MTDAHIETLRNLLKQAGDVVMLTAEEEGAIAAAIEDNDPEEREKWERMRARLAKQDQRSIFSNSPRPIVTFAPWEPPPDPAEDEC